MSKDIEEVKVVREVKVVKKLLKVYCSRKQDMPLAVVKDISKSFNKIEADYELTLKNFLECNSLVVKLERLFELIGIIGTISMEDEPMLDKTIICLENYVNSMKD